VTTRRSWLVAAVAVVAAVVALVTTVLSRPATSAEPVPARAVPARAVPCGSGYCFPAGTVAATVDALHQAGFVCIGDAAETDCAHPGRERAYVGLTGANGGLAGVKLRTIGEQYAPEDALRPLDALLGEVLPHVLSGATATQQVFTWWLGAQAHTPGGCPTGVRQGGGFTLGCLADPVPGGKIIREYDIAAGRP
jgi:hypothetical protein